METVGVECSGLEILEATGKRPAIGSHAVASPGVADRDTILYRLLLFNIVLQVFDGVATYYGMHWGVREGNPLLRGAFHLWGVVPTLVMLKANACVLLWFIYWAANVRVATPALAMLGGVYAVCSLIPWLGVFVILLMRFV